MTVKSIQSDEHTALGNAMASILRAAVETLGIDYGQAIGVCQCVLTDSVLLNELDPEVMLVAVIRDRVKREPNVQGGMQ